jgi:hypothetical protein
MGAGAAGAERLAAEAGAAGAARVSLGHEDTGALGERVGSWVDAAAAPGAMPRWPLAAGALTMATAQPSR